VSKYKEKPVGGYSICMAPPKELGLRSKKVKKKNKTKPIKRKEQKGGNTKTWQNQ
jgi:hypothetical protein